MMNIERTRSALPRAMSQLYVAANFAAGLLQRKAIIAPKSAEAHAWAALETARKAFDAWLIEAGQVLESEDARIQKAAADRGPRPGLGVGFDPAEDDSAQASLSVPD